MKFNSKKIKYCRNIICYYFLQTTKPPSNLTKEKVEDILIEEEEEELEMLSNLSKEAEDRASSNTIIVQDIIEETESEKSVEEGSPLLNFFKALFNN